MMERLTDFNPRTPCGVRHAERTDAALDEIISIHAPLAGCDGRGGAAGGDTPQISIHAPLAGCDIIDH